MNAGKIKVEIEKSVLPYQTRGQERPGIIWGRGVGGGVKAWNGTKIYSIQRPWGCWQIAPTESEKALETRWLVDHEKETRQGCADLGQVWSWRTYKSRHAYHANHLDIPTFNFICLKYSMPITTSRKHEGQNYCHDRDRSKKSDCIHKK